MKEQIISRIEKMDATYEMADGRPFSEGANVDRAILEDFKKLSDEDKSFVSKHFSSKLEMYRYTKIGKEMEKHV